MQRTGHRRNQLVMIAGAVAAAALAAKAPSALAASGTWSATAVDSDWANSANWAGGTVPGATSFPDGNNTSNFDVVTFNNASAVQSVSIDSNRFVRSVLFDTGAGAFTLTGSALSLRQSGSIAMSAGVTSAQVFSANWVVRPNSSTNGQYSFINNATSPTATMTFNVATNSLLANQGRPTTLTLGGSNTGENLISASLSQNTSAQLVASIIKTGTGTWVLSGSNLFQGDGAEQVATVQVNQGTLVAANNTALGTSTTANRYQAVINDGGTLELRGGIIHNNGVSLNLHNGGTIVSNGSNATNGRVGINSAVGTSVTLAALGAGDVFTIGNGSNDFSGGASDSVVNIDGLGTVLLTSSSNYVGSVNINSATLKIGSGTAVGSAATARVTFGLGSTGKLQLNGQSVTLNALSTNATTPGTPTVENGTSGTSTVTLNLASGTNTYGGTIQNGAAGTVAITKNGRGTLRLTGPLTYTGATALNAGTLTIDHTSSPSTVSTVGSLTMAGGTTLNAIGGAGSSHSFASTSFTAGHSSVRGLTGASNATLNLGALGFAIGSTVRFDGPATIDGSGNVAATGTITAGAGTSIGSGGLIAGGGTSGSTYPAFGAYATVGLYDWASTNNADGTPGTAPYTIIGGSRVTSFYSTTTPSSSTSVGNWDVTSGVNVGSGGEKRAATIRFNSPTATTVNLTNHASSETLLTNGGFLVTPNVGANNVTVGTIGAGGLVARWQIARVTSPSGAQEGVIWQNNTQGYFTFVPRITDGRDSGDTNHIVKVGDGTARFLGSNSYTGQTFINGGALVIVANDGLGAVGTGAAVNLNTGTLFADASLTLDNSGLNARGVNLNGVGGTLAASSGNTLTVTGVVGGAGTLNVGLGTLTGTGVGTANAAVLGNGKVTLASPNSFTGGTSVQSGTLAVSGTLGTGNVSVAGGAILELNTATAIGNAAIVTVALGGTIDTNVGIESVGGLFLNGDFYNLGTVGGLNSGADVIRTDYFTENSIMQVPEPSTVGLIAIGGLGLLRRRRRTIAGAEDL